MGMQYKDFLMKIKNKNDFSINFSILGYNHYNNCIIEAHTVLLPNNRNSIYLIKCRLTKDSSEDVSFINYFKEEYKLFNFGRKGKFTLKQVWNKLNIKDV